MDERQTIKRNEQLKYAKTLINFKIIWMNKEGRQKRDTCCQILCI